MQMVDDFNLRMDEISKMYGFTVADEDIRICQVAGVDNLLSFETKVNYLCEYFNTKHLELTKVIK